MKIDLNIYDSILYGDLRPWLSENFHIEKFQIKMTSCFRFQETNADSCENAILSALKHLNVSIPDNNPIYNTQDSSVTFTASDDIINAPLIEIEYLPFTNAKTEFYYYLIKNFATCQIRNLYLIINYSNSSGIDKYIINTVYNKIKSLFPEISECIRNYGYEDDMPFDPSDNDSDRNTRKDTDFILKTLRVNLIRMIFEIQELFKDFLVAPILSDNDVYSQLAGIISPYTRIKKDITKLNEFLVKKFISRKTYSLVEAKTRINYTKEYFNRYKEIPATTKEITERNELLTVHIMALENLIYIKEFKGVNFNPSYEELISENYTQRIYEEETSLLQKLIDDKQGHIEKLEFINQKIDSLYHFQSNVLNGTDKRAYSIPQKLLNWLNISCQHISETKHIITESPKRQIFEKIPTDLSVDKLAYLFRALCDGKVMQPKVETDMYKAIEALFSSAKKDDLSLKSIKNKFTTPEPKAVEYWIDAFTHLQRIAQKKYDEIIR